MGSTAGAWCGCGDAARSRPIFWRRGSQNFLVLDALRRKLECSTGQFGQSNTFTCRQARGGPALLVRLPSLPTCVLCVGTRPRLRRRERAAGRRDWRGGLRGSPLSWPTRRPLRHPGGRLVPNAGCRGSTSGWRGPRLANHARQRGLVLRFSEPGRHPLNRGRRDTGNSGCLADAGGRVVFQNSDHGSLAG